MLRVHVAFHAAFMRPVREWRRFALVGSGQPAHLTGAAFLAFPSPAARRWTFAVTGAGACMLSIAFGAMAVDTLA